MRNKVYPVNIDGINQVGTKIFLENFELVFDFSYKKSILDNIIENYMELLNKQKNEREIYFVLAHTKLIPLLTELKFIAYKTKILKQKEINHLLIKNKIMEVDCYQWAKEFLENSKKTISYEIEKKKTKNIFKNFYYIYDKIKKGNFNHISGKIDYIGYKSHKSINVPMAV